MSDRVQIKRLPSGVQGLDRILGGGLPEYSLNLIAGGPGCGKTTLAHQIMFTNATEDRPALYVSILGEPPIKMLRYQQQFEFFDPARVPSCIRFRHVDPPELERGLPYVLETIVQEVEESQPRLVVVDSFRAVARRFQPAQSDLQQFVQSLALQLTSWEATTFLVGEYQDQEGDSSPVFSLADGIVWLYQSLERNSIVRKLQVVKMRGQSQIPGLHTMRISSQGLRAYPRLPNPDQQKPPAGAVTRCATGIAGLDEMMGGGVPAGQSLMIVGPSGSGKTLLSTQFILEGIRLGEPGVIAVFEKQPQDYLRSLPHGKTLENFVKEGSLRLLHLRPLDLSVDETMEELGEAVRAIGARRLAIDSLSGLELALAPTFREDFRESLYRMVGALTQLGVTVVMTAELVDSYTELRLSPAGISFVTDSILLQRYVEVAGALERVMMVVKMRGQAHSKTIQPYEIGSEGIRLVTAKAGMTEILTGGPNR